MHTVVYPRIHVGGVENRISQELSSALHEEGEGLNFGCIRVLTLTYGDTDAVLLLKNEDMILKINGTGGFDSDEVTYNSSESKPPVPLFSNKTTLSSFFSNKNRVCITISVKVSTHRKGCTRNRSRTAISCRAEKDSSCDV